MKLRKLVRLKSRNQPLKRSRYPMFALENSFHPLCGKESAVYPSIPTRFESFISNTFYATKQITTHDLELFVV